MGQNDRQGDDEYLGPLSDIRVLEIGYGIAAPVCARTLAEFGADAIKVESVRRPDSLRTVGAGWLPLSVPWEIRRDTQTSLNGFTSSEKRSVALELDTPQGMAVFRRLVSATDVLVMNMSLDAVESLKLRYSDLQELNPGLIYLNLYAFGSEGPYASFRTWGGNLAALSGVTALVGWDDRPPSGLPLSFPDYPSSMWGVIAVVAALLRRDETGSGAELEVAQMQVAAECIAPSIAETVVTGESSTRSGDRVRGNLLDGIFPSRDDRHVAVTVRDDADADRLGSLDGMGAFVFPAVSSQLSRLEMIGDRLSEWTAARSAWEATWRLQEVGIAAFPVVNMLEVLGDDHLASRGFFRALPHARFEAELCYGQAVRLSETPPRFTRAGPAFGEHTREVLSELAAMGDDEIDGLVARGVAHEMSHRDVELSRPYYSWIRHVLPLQWPPGPVDPAEVVFARFQAQYGEGQ